jgi:hypothetical protein
VNSNQLWESKLLRDTHGSLVFRGIPSIAITFAFIVQGCRARNFKLAFVPSTCQNPFYLDKLTVTA